MQCQWHTEYVTIAQLLRREIEVGMICCSLHGITRKGLLAYICTYVRVFMCLVCICVCVCAYVCTYLLFFLLVIVLVQEGAF